MLLTSTKNSSIPTPEFNEEKIARVKMNGFNMAKRAILKVVKFLEQCMKENGLNVSKIILFGSQAAGKATKDSDIDILA